jgi:hypothetical protein
MKRHRRPHAQIHLPPLNPDQALALADVLERAIRAVWRAHGEDMADLQARLGIETPKPEDAVWVGRPRDPNENDEIDF